MSNYINNSYKSVQNNYLYEAKYSRGLSDHDYEVYRNNKNTNDTDTKNTIEKLENEIENIKEYIQCVYFRTASRGDQILTKDEKEIYNKYKKLLPEKEEKLAKMKEGKGLVFSATA